MSKLRGNKLEAEVDKCRGECNWLRLEELLSSVRSKGSGMEKQASLFEGELELERFIERQKDRVQPNQRFRSRLCTAEGFLKQAIAHCNEWNNVVMEAHLLLAKLHYLIGDFATCLEDVRNSRLDHPDTLFRTLRNLKLAAEGYAIRGFALQHQLQGQVDNSKQVVMRSSFEQAVELGLSYVTEFEKSINSNIRVPSATPLTTQQQHSEVFHIGDLLVTAMECAPSVVNSFRRAATDKQADHDGVEKYRHIMTTLSDKSAVEHIQQRLCRQLAEVLLRGSFESSYSIGGGSSPAINQKSEKLNFYTGSSKNYYSPSSRVEEIILVLLISELIASRSVKSSRHSGDAWQQSRSVENLKQVHNLLSVVLSRLRQHSLLSLLMDRAVQYTGADRYIWRQFGLALACTGRFPRAIKVLEHGITLEQHSEGALPPSTAAWDANERLIEHMQVAKMLIEQQQDAEQAMFHAHKALDFCTSDSLHARCKLLYALAYSLNLRNESSFVRRKYDLKQSVTNFELAVNLDPHDDLTHLFCALEYAEARNLDQARKYCGQAMELNPCNPAATMLMALIFTTKHDYKNALKLVVDAAVEFPNHYGLLVLKLRLESRFGRIDRALKTSRALLSFWRRPSTNDAVFEDDPYHTLHSLNNEGSVNNNTRHAENGSAAQRLGSIAMLTSKEVLGPVTPIFTAPLGIPASALPQHGTINSASTLELSEAASNLGHATATRLSEIGGAATSTASDSLGIGTSSSFDWTTINTFRVRANIWVELAELFIDSDYLAELTVCVNEAFNLFPGLFQVMYLKGRLSLLQAEKLANSATIASIEAREKLCSEARAHFLSALSVNPTHWQSFRHLSHVYRLESNVKMAEKMLRDALAVDPLQEELWQELGQVLAEQQCFDEANECFKTAANIDCTSPLMPFTMIPRTLKSAY